MVTFLRENSRMIMLSILWVVTSIAVGKIVMALVFLTMFFMAQKRMYLELFLGFLFTLVLSDNLHDGVAYAKSFKNVYIVFLLVLFLLDKESFPLTIKMYLYFIPYIIFAVIGMIYSPVIDVAVQKTISYIILFIIVPNYVMKLYDDYGAYFYHHLLYFMLLICLSGLAIAFYDPRLVYSHGGRFSGIFGNPNGIGMFLMLFGIMFFIVDKKYPEIFSRSERSMFLILILLLIYYSGSRNALLSLMLFFLFSYVFSISNYLGFIFFFLVLFLTEYITRNFVGIVESLGLGEKLRVETLKEGSGRLVAWNFAWQNIQKSLLLGKGMGFDEYLMRQNASTLTVLGHEGGVHNTYLIMWLNTGLFGVLSFFIALFSLFVRMSLKSNYAFPVLIAVLFSINFEPWLAASLNPFTILLLIIMTLLMSEYYITNENANEEPVAQVA